MSAESILAQFNRCRDWILPALREEDGLEDDLLNELLLGRAQLWPGECAAVVTRCSPDPIPHQHIWLAGGDLRGVVALLGGGTAWARVMGCKAQTIKGRKGWARVMRAYGFQGDELLVRAI